MENGKPPNRVNVTKMSGNQESAEPISADREYCTILDNPSLSWSFHGSVSSDVEEDPFEMEPLMLASPSSESTMDWNLATITDEKVQDIFEFGEDNDAVTEVDNFVTVSNANNVGEGNVIGDDTNESRHTFGNDVILRVEEKTVGSDDNGETTCKINAPCLGEEHNDLPVNIVSSLSEESRSPVSSLFVPLGLGSKFSRSRQEENSKNIFDVFAGWHVVTGEEYNEHSNEKTEMTEAHISRRETKDRCNASSHRTKKRDQRQRPHIMENSRTSGRFVSEIEVLESKLTNKEIGSIKLECCDLYETETQTSEKVARKRSQEMKARWSQESQEDNEAILKHCRPCSILMERLPYNLVYKLLTRNQLRMKSAKRLAKLDAKAKKQKGKHKKHRRKESRYQTEIQREHSHKESKLNKYKPEFMCIMNENSKDEQKIRLKKVGPALNGNNRELENNKHSKYIEQNILNDSSTKKCISITEHEITIPSDEQISGKINNANKENNSNGSQVLSNSKSVQKINESRDVDNRKRGSQSFGGKSMEMEMLHYTESGRNTLMEYCNSGESVSHLNANSQERLSTGNNCIKQPKTISEGSSESDNNFVFRLKRRRVIRTDTESSEEESFARKHRKVLRSHKRKEVENIGLKDLKMKSCTSDNLKTSYVITHELKTIADGNTPLKSRCDLERGTTHVSKELSVSLCKLGDAMNEQIQIKKPKNTGTLDGFVKRSKTFAENHVNLLETKGECKIKKNSKAASSKSILQYFTKSAKGSFFNTIQSCELTEKNGTVPRKDEETETEGKRDATLKMTYGITKELIVTLVRLETYGNSSPKKYSPSKIENHSEKCVNLLENRNASCPLDRFQISNRNESFTSITSFSEDMKRCSLNNRQCTVTQIHSSSIQQITDSIDKNEFANSNHQEFLVMSDHHLQSPNTSGNSYQNSPTTLRLLLKRNQSTSSLTENSVVQEADEEVEKFTSQMDLEDDFSCVDKDLMDVIDIQSSSSDSPSSAENSSNEYDEPPANEENTTGSKYVSVSSLLETESAGESPNHVEIQSRAANNRFSAVNCSNDHKERTGREEDGYASKSLLVTMRSAEHSPSRNAIQLVLPDTQLSAVNSYIESQERIARSDIFSPHTLHLLNTKSARDSPNPIEVQNVSSDIQPSVVNSSDKHEEHPARKGNFSAGSEHVVTTQRLNTNIAKDIPKESVITYHSSLHNTIASGNNGMSEDKRYKKLATELFRFKLSSEKSDAPSNRFFSSPADIASINTSEASNLTKKVTCASTSSETVVNPKLDRSNILDKSKMKKSSLEIGLSSKQSSSLGVLSIESNRNGTSEEPAQSTLQKTRMEACDTCDKGFQNEQLRLEHNKVAHSYQCNVCSKLFTYPKSLRQHMLTHTIDTSTYCMKCYESIYEENATVHCLNHSKVKGCNDDIDRYVCLICGRSYRQKANLHHHCRRQHKFLQKEDVSRMSSAQTRAGCKKNRMVLLCDVCEVSFKSEEGMRKHNCSYTLKTHGCLCSVCSLIFNSKESLFTHIIKHTEREYQHAERALKAKLEESRKEKDTCKVEEPDLIAERETQNVLSEGNIQRAKRNEHKLHKGEDDGGAELMKQTDWKHDKAVSGPQEFQQLRMIEKGLGSAKVKQERLKYGTGRDQQNVRSNKEIEKTEWEKRKLKKIGVEGEADEKKKNHTKDGLGHTANGQIHETGRGKGVERSEIDNQVIRSGGKDCEAEMSKEKLPKGEESHRAGRDKQNQRKNKYDREADRRNEKLLSNVEGMGVEGNDADPQKSEVHRISKRKESYDTKERSNKELIGDHSKTNLAKQKCDHRTERKMQRAQEGESDHKKDIESGSGKIRRSNDSYEVEYRRRHGLRTDEDIRAGRKESHKQQLEKDANKLQEEKQKLRSDETYESVNPGQDLLVFETARIPRGDKPQLETVIIMKNYNVRGAQASVIVNEGKQTIGKLTDVSTEKLSENVTLKLGQAMQAKLTERIAVGREEQKERDGRKLGAESVKTFQIPSSICDCHKNCDSKADNNIKFELTLFCIPCRILFRTKECFNKHMSEDLWPDTHHDGTVPRLFCNRCHAILDSLQSLRLHVEEHIRQNAKDTVAFVCKICEIVFLRVGPLFYKHWLSHRENHSYVESHSTLAQTSAVDPSHLENFSHELTKKYMFVSESLCSICRISFKSESELKAHMIESLHAFPKSATIHESLEPTSSLECSICNQFFLSKFDFDLHLRDHREILPTLDQSMYNNITTGQTEYVCSICKGVFTSTAHFEIHSQKHAEQFQTFMCNYCYVVVDTFHDYERHLQNPENDIHRNMGCKILFTQSKFQHIVSHSELAGRFKKLPSQSSLEVILPEGAVSNQEPLKKNTSETAILNQKALEHRTSQATVLIQEASKDFRPKVQLLNGKQLEYPVSKGTISEAEILNENSSKCRVPEVKLMREKAPIDSRIEEQLLDETASEVEVINEKELKRKSSPELVDLVEPDDDTLNCRKLLSTASGRTYDEELRTLVINCYICDRSFNNNVDLAKHQLSHNLQNVDAQTNSNEVEITETEKENQSTRAESFVVQEKNEILSNQNEKNRGFLRVRSLTELLEKRWYKCSSCGLTFDEQQKLNDHMHMQHNSSEMKGVEKYKEASYVCNVFKNFHGEGDKVLKNHSSFHCPGPDNQDSRGLGKCLQYFVPQYGKQIYQCNQCPHLKCDTDEALRQHKDLHSLSQTNWCKLCSNYVCATEREIRQHEAAHLQRSVCLPLVNTQLQNILQQTATVNTSWYPIQSEQTANAVMATLQRTDTMSQKGPSYRNTPVYTCRLCKNFTCRTEQELKAHAMEHMQNDSNDASDDYIICKYCPNNMLFKGKEKLREHEATNHKFTCKQCTAVFVLGSHLRQHESTHHSPETSCQPSTTRCLSFFCKLCLVGFTYESELRMHEQIKHSNTTSLTSIYQRPNSWSSTFQCDICGTILCSEVGLKCHKKLHRQY